MSRRIWIVAAPVGACAPAQRPRLGLQAEQVLRRGGSVVSVRQ
jgi:hypothetical protein